MPEGLSEIYGHSQITTLGSVQICKNMRQCAGGNSRKRKHKAQGREKPAWRKWEASAGRMLSARRHRQTSQHDAGPARVETHVSLARGASWREVQRAQCARVLGALAEARTCGSGFEVMHAAEIPYKPSRERAHTTAGRAACDGRLEPKVRAGCDCGCAAFALLGCWRANPSAKLSNQSQPQSFCQKQQQRVIAGAGAFASRYSSARARACSQ